MLWHLENSLTVICWLHSSCDVSISVILLLELCYSLFWFKSRSELGLEPGADPGTVYNVGQAVKCRVISCIPASRRINLSFIIKPTRFASFPFCLSSYFRWPISTFRWTSLCLSSYFRWPISTFRWTFLLATPFPAIFFYLFPLSAATFLLPEK